MYVCVCFGYYLILSIPNLEINVDDLKCWIVFILFIFYFLFLLLFNYSCMPFLPIPPPHPSWTHLPPPPPPSPEMLNFKVTIREKNWMDGRRRGEGGEREGGTERKHYWFYISIHKTLKQTLSLFKDSHFHGGSTKPLNCTGKGTLMGCQHSVWASCSPYH